MPFAYSGFRTLSTPPLNRYEFASSWPPHSEATTGCEPYLPAFFRPLTTPWPWSTPTVVAVERRVQDGRAALDLAVVVDRLDALRKGCPLDRGRGAGVDRGDDQDLRAVGDALIGLRLLLLRVALGVDDAGRDMGGLEGLLQVRPVELLPADRRLGVGHQAARQDAGALPAARPGRDHGGNRGDDADGDHLPRMLHVLPPSLRSCRFLRVGSSAVAPGAGKDSPMQGG